MVEILQKDQQARSEANEITDAEWEIIRIIWAHSPLTSRQIIQYAQEISSWKEATIKTLLHRLVQKQKIAVDRNQKPFIYSCLMTQDQAIHESLEQIFERICNRQKGAYLHQLLLETILSQTECDDLVQLLIEKKKEAPEEVVCNCPPAQCCCHSCRS